MKTIFLHVGLRKTGTTAIQAALYNAQNNLILKSENYLYVSSIGQNAQRFILNYFSSNPERYHFNIINNIDIKKIKNDRNTFFENFEKEILEFNGDNIIISTEDFCYITQEELLNFQTYLKEIFNEQVNIKPIIFFREPISWVTSIVQQFIKTRYLHYDIILSNLHNYKNHYLNEYDKYKLVFGEENLIICNYEDVEKGNIVNYFLKKIGVSEKIIKKIDSNMINKSSSNVAIDLVSYINKKEPFYVENNIDKNEIEYFEIKMNKYDFEKYKINNNRVKSDLEMLFSIVGNKFYLSKEDIQKVNQIFKEDLEFFEKKYHFYWRTNISNFNENVDMNDEILDSIRDIYNKSSSLVIRKNIIEFLSGKIKNSEKEIIFLNELKQNKLVKYACFVDNSSKFIYQAWNLVNSLINNARIKAENIYIHYSEGMDTYFLDKCRNLGINTCFINKFGDGKYCNKITQLSNAKLYDTDLLVLLDTDMVVLKNFENNINTNKIYGKIVDFPNPSLDILDEIFALANIHKRPEKIKTDLSDELTYNGNFNGGLYILPGDILEELYQKWKEYALWLLDIKILHKYEKGIHVDQVSFCLALNEFDNEIENLSRLFNFPLHIEHSYEKEIPFILHYHWLIKSNGLIYSDFFKDGPIAFAIKNANDEIIKSFEYKLFWDYLYDMNINNNNNSEKNELYLNDIITALNIDDFDTISEFEFADNEISNIITSKSVSKYCIIQKNINSLMNKKSNRNFLNLYDIDTDTINSSEFVISSSLLKYQLNKEDYLKYVNLLSNKTSKILLVAGYNDNAKKNNRLNYYESLKVSLENTGEFNQIIKIYSHDEVDYYLAIKDIDEDKLIEFYKKILEKNCSNIVNKILYIHIGLPKTKTTSLQTCFYENREILRMNDVYYPDKCIRNRHQEIMHSLMENDFNKFVEFFKTCHENLESKVFVSVEGLSNHYLDFDRESLLFFKGLSVLTDVKIILTLRNQSSFLNSYYKQCVSNPKNEKFLYGFTGSIEEFYKYDRIKQLLNYEMLVNEYVELVGEQNLVIIPNEFNNIDYFLNLLNINDKENFKDIESKNVSLSEVAIDLICGINEFIDNQSKQKIIDLLKNSENFTISTTEKLDSQMNEMIKNDYNDINNRLIIKYPILKNELSFDENFLTKLRKILTR